jgi:hypothetical protein
VPDDGFCVVLVFFCGELEFGWVCRDWLDRLLEQITSRENRDVANLLFTYIMRGLLDRSVGKVFTAS